LKEKVYRISQREPGEDHMIFDLLLFVHHVIIMVRDKSNPVTPSFPELIGFTLSGFLRSIAHLD